LPDFLIAILGVIGVGVVAFLLSVWEHKDIMTNKPWGRVVKKKEVNEENN